MKIKLFDARPLERNTLKGFFSIRIADFRIDGFSYHTKGDKSWIGFPSKEFNDRETGERKYWQIVKIEDDERYKKFQAWATGQAKKLFDTLPENKKPEPTIKNREDDDIPF